MALKLPVSFYTVIQKLHCRDGKKLLAQLIHSIAYTNPDISWYRNTRKIPMKSNHGFALVISDDSIRRNLKTGLSLTLLK